ncbi:MAG: HAD-IIB family hydrolase [Oscillospiraceae bacterium]
METLYISDVDGTLTRQTASPTERTRQIIRGLVESGTSFTIATGRSLGGAILIKEQLGISLPVISFNGSLVFDTKENLPLNIIPIEKETAEKLFDLFEDAALPFRYCIYNHKLGQVISYREEKSQFPISETINPKTGLTYEKVVVGKNIRQHHTDGDVLYVGYSCEKEKLLRLGENLDNLKDISYSIHSDPYQDDYWYMDIYSAKSGKNVGAQFLKKHIGADELVTFGDNFNDYCLLKNADRSYAVPEADATLKEIATGILQCDNDCVANFILNDKK